MRDGWADPLVCACALTSPGKVIVLSLLNFVGLLLDESRVRRTVLAVFGFAALLTLRVQSPLGWDESVYASRAKDLERTNFDWDVVSSPYWSDLRAPGFPAFAGFAFEIFGTSDFIVRAVIVGFSVGLLAMIARTLDLIAPPRVGTTAALIAALCPGFFATSTLAFGDNAAAFFAVVAVWALLRAHVSGSTGGLVVAPAAIAVATSIRFGAVMLVVAPLGLVALAVSITAIRRRSYRDFFSFLAAGLISVAVVAYLLTSTFLTRLASPLDASAQQRIVNDSASGRWLSDLRTILSPGPVDYGFNGAFWGWSFFSVFILTLLVVVTKALIDRRIGLLFVATTIGFVQVGLYAWFVNQYVTTYLAPQFAIGAAALAMVIWGPPLRSLVAPDYDSACISAETGARPGARSRAGALVLVAAVVFVGWRTFEGAEAMHRRLTGFEQVRVASTIADDVLGQNCRIFTTRVPQVSWYSVCNATGFSGSFQPDGEAVGDGLSWDDYVAVQAGRVDSSGGAGLGFLLLEGVRSQPPIDEVLKAAEGDAVVLMAPTGRRVALVEVTPGG